ncbi:MAG: mechanosensitive ion channel family protein [Sandaracinaceae bacterium]
MDVFAELAAFWNLELFRLGSTPVTPVSVLVFLVTLVVSMLLGRLARSLIRRVLGPRPGISEGVTYAIGRIVQYTVILVGVLVGLENVGISITAFAAFGAVLSVGIGFGLQNIAQNFISGLILLLERPVERGDFVELGGVVGHVDDIAMRATRVITLDGISVLVPNSELITSNVSNMSAPTKRTRVRIEVGVAYGSDTAKVRECLLRVAREHHHVLDSPAPKVFFEGFGDSSLDFMLGAWVADPAHRPETSSDLRFAVDQAFRDECITIPFPQRDLHVVSGADALRASKDTTDDAGANGSALAAGGD